MLNLGRVCEIIIIKWTPSRRLYIIECLACNVQTIQSNTFDAGWPFCHFTQMKKATTTYSDEQRESSQLILIEQFAFYCYLMCLSILPVLHCLCVIWILRRLPISLLNPIDFVTNMLPTPFDICANRNLSRIFSVSRNSEHSLFDVDLAVVYLDPNIVHCVVARIHTIHTANNNWAI